MQTITESLDDLLRRVDELQPEEFRTRILDLKAELAACGSTFDVSAYVRDALRYRFLRERDVDAIYAGGVFVGKTPDNIVLNGIHLDAAVDAARIAEQEPDAGE
ncbi:hypothetical protein DNX69_10730 [Rhodopseudomonas palustris]|uniref:Uncharacterized protein n=1 Tax=Rhodopseudomonas palustris TaxID=1076 RepID=A0A323UIT4_RHOPL|nr:hypothetical protein [Rhodopseudomonas palustris]PZA12444.1 hypothetical protein DNX69_10730 [Rhodopseudomonas palustris]